ncbi:TetR/AcrR family transcriptional regulator [Camelimonas sp. ID_303_24]
MSGETRKRTRREKQSDTLEALVSAAIQVVGNEGYAAASITKITALANVANGTFYNYFDSRQDLFDQLLPIAGERLIAHLRANVAHGVTGLERERQRICAYFDYLRLNPGFIRIFHEAEIHAPRAYARHLEAYLAGYGQALGRSLNLNELGRFSREDIPVLGYLLMGMQDYMAMLLQSPGSDVDAERMVSVYLRLIGMGGLFVEAAPPQPVRANS